MCVLCICVFVLYLYLYLQGMKDWSVEISLSQIETFLKWEVSSKVNMVH